MQISVYLPLLLSAVLALSTPVLKTRLAPRLAARILATTAALTAGASTWGLLLMATTLLQHTPEAEERGRQPHPVPTLVAVLALVAVTWLAYRAHRALQIRRRTERALREVAQTSHPGGELCVVSDDALYAYAVPGQRGRILISTGLLQKSDPADRCVILAHERAHLREAHHRLRAACELAAAVNPLLIPTRAAVAYLVERAADEAAAEVLGDRRRTATALAKVALSMVTPAAPALLGFHQHAVLDRVAALHRPPVSSVRTLAAACLLSAVATTAAAGDATVAFGRIALSITGL